MRQAPKKSIHKSLRGTTPHALTHNHQARSWRDSKVPVVATRAFDYSVAHSECMPCPSKRGATIQITARADTGTKQTGKNGCFRHPPRQAGWFARCQARSRAVLGVGALVIVCYAQARRPHPLQLTGAYCLNWRTRVTEAGRSRTRSNRPALGFSFRTAASAFIEKKLTRHRSAIVSVFFCDGAVRTGDGRLKKHRISSWARDG